MDRLLQFTVVLLPFFFEFLKVAFRDVVFHVAYERFLLVSLILSVVLARLLLEQFQHL